MSLNLDFTTRPVILVVDDTPDNLTLMAELLQDRYAIKVANNGERALRVAAGTPPPDLILLDIMMPDMDGLEVARRLRADPATRDIPFIFLTARSQIEDERQGFELGAVDYITKPVNPAIVLARVRTHLALYDQNRELARQVRERTADLFKTRQQIIRRLGRAAEFRDNETGNHIIRMSHFCRLIGIAAGLGEKTVEILYNASPMHDVGKIGIPDAVLRKPGKLDGEEWEVMKQHAQIGADIIGEHPSGLLRMAREIALNHHEKWDGSGYPRGIGGAEIPVEARIIAIADVFDALTSERPYKKAWSVEAAVQLLREQSGRHFDPELVELFLGQLPAILEIKERWAERD